MVLEKLIEILAEQFDVDATTITLETNIIDDFDADSLDLVDLLMSLEESFGIEMPDEEIDGINTVADVVKYIEDNR